MISVVDRAELTEEQHQLIAKLRRRPWSLVARPGPFRLALRTWPLLAIALAFALGSEWAPSTAGHEYFSAAAQVIPVLLLALASASGSSSCSRWPNGSA
jgi:hypothetical protein